MTDFIIQITSLVLIRTFQTDWFEFLLLGETVRLVRLVFKFWFGDGAKQK